MNVDEFPVEDVEGLRDELIDLSEKGEIKETKVFLKSKKCTKDHVGVCRKETKISKDADVHRLCETCS